MARAVPQDGQPGAVTIRIEIQLLDAPGAALWQSTRKPQQHTLHASVGQQAGNLVIVVVVRAWLRLRIGGDPDAAQVLEAAQQPLAGFGQRVLSCHGVVVDLRAGTRAGRDSVDEWKQQLVRGLISRQHGFYNMREVLLQHAALRVS